MDLLLQRTAEHVAAKTTCGAHGLQAVNPLITVAYALVNNTHREMICPVCSMEDVHGVLAVPLLVGALCLALTAQQSQDLVVTPPTGCRVC